MSMRAVMLAAAVTGVAAMMSPSDAPARSTPAGQTARATAALVADYEALIRSEDDDAPGWPDRSPAAETARRARLEALSAALSTPAPAGEDDAQRLTRELLLWRVAAAAEAARFDAERLAFISGDGFHTRPGYAAAGTVIRSDADAQRWLRRLAALPSFYDQSVANLRRGVATGWTQPLPVVDATLAQMRALGTGPVSADVLLKPFAGARPPAIDEARWRALRAEAESLLTRQVRPAQAAAIAYVEREYRPHARAGLGAATMPGGRAYYAYLVRYNTTADLTPDQVFAIGQAEVRRIRGEMEAAIRATGFRGDFPAFLGHVRTDRRFYAVDLEDYLEKSAEIAKRADYLLPRFFKTLPRLPYGVRQTPPEAEGSTGAYFLGSPERGIAGSVMVGKGSTRNPLFSLPAWILHEGAPGHHIQIALGQEREDLPRFRRRDDITAFVEGWALYAERLGVEMGIYRNPYEAFGRLSFEIWRACRLVMDVGIHWKGWSFDQAAACLRENSALPEGLIRGETLRYIGWPGQALGYKIGEMRISAMRRRAEQALGTRFDIRAFHDAVIGDGPMPMAVLDRHIDRWIAAQQAAPTSP